MRLRAAATAGVDPRPDPAWVFSPRPYGLLQPNRYKVAGYVVARKVYVDGDQEPSLTARVRGMHASPEITAESFGAPLRFRRTPNRHAGCFFLSAALMAHWAGRNNLESIAHQHRI